jgi:inosine/xanthosine triphosphate pyrophosphatase family protein
LKEFARELFFPKPQGSHGFGYDPFFHCKEANADFGLVE